MLRYVSSQREKEDTIRELQETNVIMKEKIRHLQQLVKLKVSSLLTPDVLLQSRVANKKSVTVCVSTAQDERIDMLTQELSHAEPLQ